jgi:hypothetical protein
MYFKKYIIRIVLKIFIFGLFILLSCSSQNNEIGRNYNFVFPENIKIITQKDWGGINNQQTIKSHKIESITLHHGGVEFQVEKDPIEYMRNLQSWSRSEKKWIDIPYHFLIDLNGNIYEGRSIEYPGDTNTTYDPIGHLLICVMGNYEIQIVNSEQLKSIVNLISFFCKELNINPELVRGHKDYAETACPGKDIYKYLENGNLVHEVNNQLK